jgi:hypothetical protein
MGTPVFMCYGVNGAACAARSGLGADALTAATETLGASGWALAGFGELGGVKTWGSSSCVDVVSVATASVTVVSGVDDVEGVVLVGVVLVGVVLVGVVSVGVVSVGVVSVGVVSVGVVSSLQWSSFWPPWFPCSSHSLPCPGCGSSLHGFWLLPCSQAGWPGGDGGLSEVAANAAAPPSPNAAIIAAIVMSLFMESLRQSSSDIRRAAQAVAAKNRKAGRKAFFAVSVPLRV